MNQPGIITTQQSKVPGVIKPDDLLFVQKLVQSLHNPSLQSSLEELSKKVHANRFYLVVVGLFKRGKSSLINALIGRELVPVGVTPLTSVITFIEYGTYTRGEVLFEDGRKLVVPIPEVIDYVSEEENPENEKKVQSLTIYTNASILEQITLVDTPGIGSLFSHNNKTTFGFIPKIDAALFVLSADIPISKSDERFLLEIKKSIPNVLFVLNKADSLSENELQKMLNYNVVSIKKILAGYRDENDLIPVSSRAFFTVKEDDCQFKKGDNLNVLRQAIDEKIIASRDDILRIQSLRRFTSLVDYTGTLLQAKMESLQLPVDELEKKRVLMQQSINRMTGNRGDYEAIMESKVNLLKKKVAEIIGAKRKELEKYCTYHLVSNANKTWEQIKESDANLYSQQLLEYITDQYKSQKNELESQMREEFSGILRQFSEQYQSFFHEIGKQMEQILGIGIENLISSFDLDVYSPFYIYKADMKYSIRSLRKKLIYKVIPDTWIRRRVLKRIYCNCMLVVNQNEGRIRSDIDYKINESFRKFKSELRGKLYELLGSLSKMIDESIYLRIEIEGEIEEILPPFRRQLEQINQMGKRYSALLMVNTFDPHPEKTKERRSL